MPLSRAGSIPACAGEPVRVGRFGKPVGVYPRVCGGTTVRIEPERRCYGLSPRVRGNLNHVRISKSQHGSIPACAGEPSMVALLHDDVSIPACAGEPCGNLGLSPRVRGNRNCRVALSIAAGSIPACAGEPELPRCTINRCRVYPRVCGGTGTAALHYQSLPGLSPRVRGNRNCRVALSIAAGSIPACAGEPDKR